MTQDTWPANEKELEAKKIGFLVNLLPRWLRIQVQQTLSLDDFDMDKVFRFFNHPSIREIFTVDLVDKHRGLFMCDSMLDLDKDKPLGPGSSSKVYYKTHSGNSGVYTDMDILEFIVEYDSYDFTCKRGYNSFVGLSRKKISQAIEEKSTLENLGVASVFRGEQLVWDLFGKQPRSKSIAKPKNEIGKSMANFLYNFFPTELVPRGESLNQEQIDDILHLFFNNPVLRRILIEMEIRLNRELELILDIDDNIGYFIENFSNNFDDFMWFIYSREDPLACSIHTSPNYTKIRRKDKEVAANLSSLSSSFLSSSLWYEPSETDIADIDYNIYLKMLNRDLPETKYKIIVLETKEKVQKELKENPDIFSEMSFLFRGGRLEEPYKIYHKNKILISVLFTSGVIIGFSAIGGGSIFLFLFDRLVPGLSVIAAGTVLFFAAVIFRVLSRKCVERRRLEVFG